MIYTRLGNLKDFFHEEDYPGISGFLKGIREDMEDGEYPICGEKAFARVMTYSTIPAEEAKIEAHDRYIDVQFALKGAEGISVFDRESLKEKEPYDSERDIIFFETKGTGACAHTDSIPGYCTILFPEDAHRPQERIRDTREVKKAVIKLMVQDQNA